MNKIKEFFKKETVLCIAWLLAILSAFFVMPSAKYIEYIDFRSLGILWSLMVIMKGFQVNGLFEQIGLKLLTKTKKVWQLCAVLIMLCFFSSMFITNDVALITFVPFSIMMLRQCNKESILIPVIVLQTIAANLGSMLTPIGNPQNLYLYGISGMSIYRFIMWMLPGALISIVMLVISITFIHGKNDDVIIKHNTADKSSHTKKLAIIVYTILFILSLVTVARIIPYQALIIAVLILVLILQRRILIDIDYALLFTFIGFFIFTGNMGNISIISDALMKVVLGRELLVGILASQFISNVPAALLLSGFTWNIKELLYGVNLGGLGTLIASMASLISYKAYAHEYNENKGKYILTFTIYNVVFLIILVLAKLFFIK